MSAVSLLAILLPAQFWKRYFKISLYYYVIYVFLSFYVFISLIQLLSSLVYTHFCLLLPHHELYPFYYYISSSWLANLKLNFTISHQYCLSFLFSHLPKISLPLLYFLLHFQCVFYRHTALFSSCSDGLFQWENSVLADTLDCIPPILLFITPYIVSSFYFYQFDQVTW